MRENTKSLIRRLGRAKKKQKQLKEEHRGKESSIYNYYAGWELGYLQGRVSGIEDTLDEVTPNWDEAF